MRVRSASFPILLALALLLGVAACRGSEVRAGTGHGSVVAVDTAAGEITLDHGEIPGVMGAMKMSFPVADPKLLDGVQPGQSVDFDVEYRGGMYTVKAIRPQGG
jgi:Cu(I)/Ag(I) efflux system protein CusF